MSDALFAAMAKAFPEIEGAAKDSHNPHFKSNYADLSSVVAAIKPALVKNGLFYIQLTHEQTGGVCVETVLCHSSGQQMSFGKLFVPSTKQDAQGYGSALSYCRRYSLMTAFGVCPEDDDGNAASKPAEKPQERPQQPPEPLIDDMQKDELQMLCTHLGVPVGDVLKAKRIQSLNFLPAASFDGARDWINARAKKLREEKEQTA